MGGVCAFDRIRSLLDNVDVLKFNKLSIMGFFVNAIGYCPLCRNISFIPHSKCRAFRNSGVFRLDAAGGRGELLVRNLEVFSFLFHKW